MTTPKVLLKRSSVVGRVPQSGDLDYGELAINFADGKIYYKDNSNTIKAFIDSARTQSLIDAVNQAAENQLDSAEVIDLIDSAYVQLRQSYNALTLGGDSGDYYRNYHNLYNKPLILDIVDIQNIIDNYVNQTFVDNLNVDADTLDGLNSTQFLRSDSDTRLTADLIIDSNLTVGGDATFNNNVTLSGNLYGPATMYIDPAAHDSDTGRVIIRGDLQVDGTQTIVNSTTVSINDKNIVLADSATNAAEADGAGITVNGANANITYNAAEDEWQFNKKTQTPNLEVTNVIDATTVNTTNITATTINTTNITGNYTNFDSDFDSALGTKTTTDVAEGTNLYYTTTRADSDFDVRITTKTTNNLTEGDNLYYTTARADSDARSALSANKVSGFGNLTYDSAAGKFSYTGISTQEIRNRFAAQGDLSYDSATGVFSIDVENVYTKTNFDSDLGDASTTDLPEGSNLYYTKTRVDSDFDARFAGKSTDNLAEGNTNLYYTTTRHDSDTRVLVDSAYVQARVDSSFIATIADLTFLDSGDALQLIDSSHVQLKAKGLDYNVLSNKPALIDSTLVTQLIDSTYIRVTIDSAHIENVINNSTTVFVNNVDSAYVQLKAKNLDYNVLSNKPNLIDSGLVEGLVDSAYVQLHAKGLNYNVLSNKPNVLDSSDIVSIIVSETLDSDLIINLVDSAYIQLRDRFQDSAGVKAVIDSAYVRARVKTNQDLRTTDSVTFAGINVLANSITFGESDATMTYLPDSDMIQFNKPVKGDNVEFTGATIQSDSSTFNGLYVYDNRLGQKDWVARFSRRQNEYSSPAVVLISTDAEERSDIAFEIRGNANSNLLGPEFDDKFHDDSNTKFAIYGSGHTLIGYSNLPGGVGALYPYSMLSGDNNVKLQVNYGISVDSNLVFHEGNYKTYIDSAYIEARRPAETIFSVGGDGSNYVFSGDGFPSNANDPTLYLTRGKTYKFTNISSSHPFEIRLSNGGAAYSDGVTNNGGSGTVEFTVPMNAPTSLVYQCTVHGGMVGDIVINAAAGLDSAQIINLIDSAYVQLRDSSSSGGGGGGGGVDSATTIALIDSAYVKARVDHNANEVLIFGDDQQVAGTLAQSNTSVVSFFNSIYPDGQFIASYNYASGGLPIGQWLYAYYWVNSGHGYFQVVSKTDLGNGTYRYYCENSAGNPAPNWAGGWTNYVVIASTVGAKDKALRISHQTNGDYLFFDGRRNFYFSQNDSDQRNFKIELTGTSALEMVGGKHIHYGNSYDSDGDFPNASVFKGMVAHAKNNDALYYANDSGVWTTIAGTGAQAFQDSAVVVGLIDSDYILNKKFVPGDAERRWNITSAAPAGAQAVAVGDYWLDRDTEVLYKLTTDTNWTTTLPAGTFTAEAGLTSNNWFANGVGGDPATINQGPPGPVGTFNRTFLMGTSPYNSGGRYTFTQPVNFGYFQIGNLASGHIYSVGYTDGSYMVSNTGINGSKTATPSSYTWYDANGVSLGQTVAAGSGFRNYSHPNGTLATYIVIGRNNYGTRGYSCYMFFSGASSWQRIGEIYDSGDIKNVIDSAYVTGISGSGGSGSGLDSAAVTTLIDSAYVQARQTAGGGGTDSAAVQTLINAAIDSGAVPFTQNYFHFTSDSGHKIYSGFDDDSDSLTYTTGALTVYLNGILLVDSVDYTATNGTSIVLTDSAELGDILTVQTFAGNSLGLDSAKAINLIDSAYIAARTTAGTDSAAIINLIDSAYVQARQAAASSGVDSAVVISLIDSAYVNQRVSFTGPSSSRTSLGLTGVTTGSNNATWTFNTDASAENFKLLIDGVYLASSATGSVLGFKDAGGKYFSVGDNYNSHNFTRSVVAVRTNNAVTLSWSGGLAYSWANFTDYSGGFSAAFTANGGTLPLVSVYSPKITNGQPGSFTTPYVVGDATTGNGAGVFGTNTTNYGALVTVAASATYLSLTNVIDSAYVEARVNALDSAEAINLIDSAYVRARQNFAYSALTSTPTDLSDFDNDVGYITDASFDDFESREFIGNQGGLTDKVYSFIVPVGVTTISAVAIAGGGGGGEAASGTDGVGGGGGLSYDTSLAVTPGETLTITVGHSGNGGMAPSDPPNSIGTGDTANNTTIKRGSTVLLQANGGTGGSGGTNGTGGSGGTTLSYDGGGNGGVRGAGQYTGNGGSSGSASLLGTSSTDYLYGEGGAGYSHGQKGAVRIIWGTGRSYPDTNIVQTFLNVYSSGIDSAAVISLIDSNYVRQRVTKSDLDMEGNKVLFANVYDSTGALPSATTYHGMFAHVHATGAGYFAHAGNWTRLANQSEVSSYDSTNTIGIIDSAYVQARQTSGGGGTVDSADIIAIVDSAYVQARQTSGGGGGGGGLDSALVSQLIDSDYIATKVDFTRGEFTTQRSQYTATASQTVFNHSSIDATHLDVYLNGILQVVNDDYTANTSAVTFTTGVDSGYSVSIIERRGRVATQRGLVESKYYFTTPTPITSITGVDDNGVTLDYSNGNLDVYLNGILLKDSDDYSTNAGTTVTLISATDSNDLVTLINRKGVVVTPNVENYEFTATANQTVFSGSDINGNTLSYAPGAIQVYMNGILLRAVDYTSTTGSSIILATAAAANDEVVVSAFSNPGQNMELYKFTADSGQTIFSGNDIVGASLAYQPGNIQVFMNGLLLNDSDDYNALNGMSVVLTSGADASDEIKVASFVSNTNAIRTNAWTAPSGTPVAASAGDKLFIDVSSSAKTVTLPSSASMGDEIRIIDVTGNAATNNITVARNGHNIQGSSSDLIININRAGIGLVYYNSAQGWVLIEN